MTLRSKIFQEWLVLVMDAQLLKSLQIGKMKRLKISHMRSRQRQRQKIY